MRKINFKADRDFYDHYIAPSSYKKDYLDIYRFNLLLKFLKLKFKLKSPFENRIILNVAGGYGREAYLLFNCKPKKIILSDYSFNQLIQAKKYLKDFNSKYLLCADAEFLPIKDKSIDIFFINEALHHFMNPLKSIDEAIRVSKGFVILDEPYERRGISRFLEFIFVSLKLKEKLERGYLESFRIDRIFLQDISLRYKIKILFYPYFIYYFNWYKYIKFKFIKLFYQKLIKVLNLFFHNFGNRVIVIISLKENEDNFYRST
ncbi:MAG: class I SAM-dependent methyltransferase [Candidatus Omnitrophica bacterium]|nr:class I SAM-dependent methyltransferase [Candidatus Omnitrophota bacterium]